MVDTVGIIFGLALVWAVFVLFFTSGDVGGFRGFLACYFGLLLYVIGGGLLAGYLLVLSASAFSWLVRSAAHHLGWT